MTRSILFAPLFAGLLAVALAPASARAGGDCHVVDVTFTTADDSANAAAPLHLRPQVVVWVEDAAGTYVDTLYITQQTGTYGLGNRPGRYDFNSGPLWPYGRRTTVFPVWSHVAKPDLVGYPFPVVEFRNASDSALSHPLGESSSELHYCQPLTTNDPRWTAALDAMSCASTGTDKGRFSTTLGTTGYPPRVDVVPGAADSADVDLYPTMNPFDGVSQATPQSGVPAQITWPIPALLPGGTYVVVVEVAKEFDYNATYNDTVYPAPTVAYGNYGLPYRGQPSVIYRVPFVLGGPDAISLTDSYAGYGDPDGQDGNVRAPDGTITTGVQGSGGARLGLVADASGTYRVKVLAHNENDSIAPGPAGEAQAVAVTGTTATVSFVAPGDDGLVGRIRGYDIRFRAGSPLTDANFDQAQVIDPPLPDDPGQVQSVALQGLLPQTDYYVGVRAYDECHNNGPLAIAKFTTAAQPGGYVDACFVATAAYGSVMANDVGMLRRFRDRMLRDNVFGELFVETYYTFGPAVSGLVDRSELLRASARAALGPLVRFAGRY